MQAIRQIMSKAMKEVVQTLASTTLCIMEEKEVEPTLMLLERELSLGTQLSSLTEAWSVSIVVPLIWIHLLIPTIYQRRIITWMMSMSHWGDTSP